MKYLLFLLILLKCATVNAQNKVFTLKDFLAQIKQFHPLAKQAGLQVEKAKAELMSARGAFDPTITVEASRKTLDEKNYYFYTNPELKIPLPVGDIKTGLESNGGPNMSNELTPGRSSYLGVEVPLAKGLLLDKRRAVLQQAKIFRNQTEQERLAMINDLIFDAYIAYGQWAAAYELYAVFNNYLKVSTERLRLIRIAAKNGDRSPMDTLEAFTQLQNFEMLQANALLSLNNATFDMSNFLWQQNDSAYQMTNTQMPDVKELVVMYDATNADGIIANAITQNPNIRMYNFKLEGLEVERKLKKQSLLPTLNAKANLLNKEYAVLNGFNSAFLQNNYKWGVDFKVPLFFREGRGDYRKAKLKIEETNFELNNKRVQIENKIRTYYNEYTLFQQQFTTAKNAYINFNSLYKNELLRFTNGESSLFLVNARENKALEMLQKTIELNMKLYKARYAIDWSAGILR
jgi:outer membrane protein TolC